MGLLIEPVWNRNDLDVFAVVGRTLSLLIEPVWNRNAMSDDLDSRSKESVF